MSEFSKDNIPTKFNATANATEEEGPLEFKGWWGEEKLAGLPRQWHTDQTIFYAKWMVFVMIFLMLVIIYMAI